jgi:hypothetical protein
MSVKQVIQERKERDYNACMELTGKLEYLQKKPKAYSLYIYNITHSAKYPWAATYYTECDEFKNFVKDNNTKGNGIEIVAHGKYVNFVRTHINYDNDKITYNLVMGTDSETTI